MARVRAEVGSTRGESPGESLISAPSCAAMQSVHGGVYYETRGVARYVNFYSNHECVMTETTALLKRQHRLTRPRHQIRLTPRKNLRFRNYPTLPQSSRPAPLRGRANDFAPR